MRQFWDATLTQDVWPAVWGWRLLNARCFACSFGMAPSCLPFEYCNINFSCHSNMALWSAMIYSWRASTMHFDEEMGFQYLGPGITVLSPSDPRPPQYIPGGNRLIFSRKINLIGPNLQRDIEGALRARFPDLAQDNFGIGLVHLSYYLTEPVADPGWEIRYIIYWLHSKISHPTAPPLPSHCTTPP